MSDPIGIFNTYIHPSAPGDVDAVLASTFLSEGRLVKEFERELEKQLSLINCVAVNSGTSALHLALVLAGIQEGDEVIIPAQTFVATGLVVLQQKAKVVFADIDYETGNISASSIRQKLSAKTKAIIPVHWGGYPCDLDEIQTIARQQNILVIEDAAHALGAIYKDRTIGTISDYTCFSFQAIKHLTTGDGGALTTIHPAKYQETVVRRWFGIDRKNAPLSELGERQYDIKNIGFKYHLNDYSAALGLANLKNFSERLEKRRNIAQFYQRELKGINGLVQFNYKNDRHSAYWLYPVHVEKRLNFINAMKKKNITVSVVHQRIDRNQIFGGLNDLPNQKRFDETQIHIPIHDGIDPEKAEYIVKSIREGW
jgi:perosamine synthetase